MSNDIPLMRIKIDQLEKQNEVLRNMIFSEREEVLALTRRTNEKQERADYLFIGVGGVCFCWGLLCGFYLTVGSL